MSDTSCVDALTASSVCCTVLPVPATSCAPASICCAETSIRVFDLARRRAGALGELPHLGGDHGEAAPGLPARARLHGGVEREDVGLERDRVDHADDLDDAA